MSAAHLAWLVLVTDAAANGWALYGLGGGDVLARIGHATVTAVALGSLFARRALRPYLAAGRRGGRRRGRRPRRTGRPPACFGQRRERGTCRR